MRHLSRAEQVVVGGSVAFLLSTMVTWFEAVPRSSAIRDRYATVGSLRGVDIGLLWGPLPMLLTTVLLVGVLVERVAPGTVPEEWRPRVVARWLGVAVVALVVLEALLGESSGSFSSLVTVEVHRTLGLFVAVACAIAVGAGGVMYGKDGDERTK